MKPEAVAERWVKHPVKKVWRALCEPDLACSWLPFEGYRPEVGARFTARGPTGLARCQVVEVSPPRRVVIQWIEGGKPSQVVLELVEDVGGTRVVVRHSSESDARRQQLHALWLLALEAGTFDAVLTGGSMATTSWFGGGTGLAVGGLGAAIVAGIVVGAVTVAPSSVPRGETGEEVEAVAVVTPTPSEPKRPAPSSSRADADGPTPTTFPPLPSLGQGEPFRVFDALPTTLNPLFPATPADLRAHRLVWVPLFERSMKDFSVVSAVVDEVVVEGAELKLTMKQGPVFHDGHPITAEDVCFSVRTVLDPTVGSSLPFRERGDLVGCEVIDPLHAVVRMRKGLANPKLRAAVPVLPAHAFRPAANSAVAVRPIGSGPYRGARGRNQARYSAVDPQSDLPLIEVTEGGDPHVQVRQLLMGEVDAIVAVPPQVRADVSASDRHVLWSWDPQELVFLATGPAVSAPVRARIAAAIDRKELIELSHGPRDISFGTDVITGPFASSSAYYNRAVTDQVKVPEVRVESTLRLGFDPRVPSTRFVAETLGNQLRRGGVPTLTVKADAPNPRHHDLWLGSWHFDATEDPTKVLSPNPLGARSDRVDRLLAAMRDATTDTEQQDAAHDLHQVVAEERQWIGLFEVSNRSAWRGDVQGLSLSHRTFWADVASWEVRPPAD